MLQKPAVATSDHSANKRHDGCTRHGLGSESLASEERVISSLGNGNQGCAGDTGHAGSKARR